MISSYAADGPCRIRLLWCVHCLRGFQAHPEGCEHCCVGTLGVGGCLRLGSHSGCLARVAAVRDRAWCNCMAALDLVMVQPEHLVASRLLGPKVAGRCLTCNYLGNYVMYWGG